MKKKRGQSVDQACKEPAAADETKDKKTSWKRELAIFLFVLVMFLPVSAILTYISLHYIHGREDEHLQLRMSVIREIIDVQTQNIEETREWFDQTLASNMHLMTDTLKEYVSEEGYTGQRVFSDGFVVELDGNECIFPDELKPSVTSQITPGLIRESLDQGTVRTAQLELDWDEVQRFSDPDELAENKKEKAGESQVFYVSFGEIDDGIVYVDLTSMQEYQDFMYQAVTEVVSALEKTDKTFDGSTLVIGERDGSLELLNILGKYQAGDSLSELGIDEEDIRGENPLIKVRGTTYKCMYSTPQSVWKDMVADWIGIDNFRLVQMLPMATFGMSHMDRSLVIAYTMFLIFAPMIVLVFSIRRFVKSSDPDAQPRPQYSPKKLRIRMVNAGIAGTIGVFLAALLLQGVGQLYLEIKYGNDTLEIVKNQLERIGVQDDDQDNLSQEEWYVYSGERMASLLYADPSLATSERLKKWCDDLDIDFIMLFDDSGNETLCSSDYSGFTLSTGLGPDSSDFRRLLLGIPYVIHEPSVDSTTGFNRQMIGVTLPQSDKPGSHGALIMALMPDQTQIISRKVDFNKQLSPLARESALCLVADAEDGKVLYASDKNMTGALVTELGLSEQSLRDGYMDFGTIGDDRCFILTSRKEDNIFYYAVKTRAMFRSVLIFAAIATLLFTLEAVVLLILLLHDYRDVFKEAGGDLRKKYASGLAGMEIHDEDMVPRVEQNIPGRASDGRDAVDGQSAAAEKGPRFGDKLKNLIGWDKKTPEERASVVFQACLIVLVIAWANMLFEKNITGKGYDSMADFLLNGDWMKGANLFSICSILIILALAYTIHMILTWILILVSGFMSGKGKTICKLFCSVIRYMALFVSVYYTLYFLGFPISSIVGSVGIISLALSLGAKDLAADILAGLAIVFEKSFQVGDIIRIGDQQGIVEEIGMRSTRLVLYDNNVLTISNHNIEKVVNLTRRLSRVRINISVPIATPLDKVEELLTRELPLIGEKNDKIEAGPFYSGVRDVESFNHYARTTVYTLSISAMCEELDIRKVRKYILRELLLLFDREGIEIR